MWILGVATRYGKCQELPVSSCRANAQCMRIPAPGVPSYPNRGFTCTPFPPRSTCVDQPLWGRTDDPCGPRAPVQSVQGRGMVFLAVSTRCACGSRGAKPIAAQRSAARGRAPGWPPLTWRSSFPVPPPSQETPNPSGHHGLLTVQYTLLCAETADIITLVGLWLGAGRMARAGG